MKALNEIMEFDRGTDLVPALAVMLSVRLLAHAIRLRLRVAGLLGRCGVSHGSSRTASTPGSCSKAQQDVGRLSHPGSGRDSCGDYSVLA